MWEECGGGREEKDYKHPIVGCVDGVDTLPALAFYKLHLLGVGIGRDFEFVLS